MLVNVFLLLLGIGLGYGLYHRLLNREVHQIIRQLDLLENYLTHQPELRKTGASKPLGELVERLNQLLWEYHQALNEVRQQDQQLRQDLASISHDLRTPLTAINGYLELLSEEELHADDFERYLTIIDERTQVLSTLINNLFYLMRLEQGQIDEEIREFSLSHLLSEQLAAFYPVAQEAELELDLNLANHLIIESDIASIRRVINNLLFNIIEHGDGQAMITTGRTEAGEVYLTVANHFNLPNSHTIDPDQWWVRHYMADPARSQHNSGLGLPIVKHLVTQLHHELDYSIEDQWFSVTITFTNSLAND